MTAIRLAGSPAEVAAAYAVRAHVFVAEQGVPPELELDELDKLSAALVLSLVAIGCHL